MNTYNIDGVSLDSIDLKCMVISRGVQVSPAVYKHFAGKVRLSSSPLGCNCMILPDKTIVQLTDLSFHLSYLKGALSWDNLKLLKYMAGGEGTPFSLILSGGAAVLCHNKRELCEVTFPPYTDFYARKTPSGLPFMGSAVLQGLDWVAYQCLWPCEFAMAGSPCQFCYSGGVSESLARRGKPQPAVPSFTDAAEIARYAFETTSARSIQITGGSTMDASVEAQYITGYLEAIKKIGLRPEELLLYITPPEDMALINKYFALGASRVACSLEVWDEKLAESITPGKCRYTGRQRHLDALGYTARIFGPGKAFSNFIIGVEPIESLTEGATYLAERGIIPSASVWIPFGRPVMESLTPPGLDYFKQVKEMLSGLYVKHKLEPAGCCGLNVCVERDIFMGCGI